MATPEATVEAIAQASSWNARVTLIRRVPEEFGQGQHASVYARIAERVYVPHLKPDFAYVHWRPDYELAVTESAYEAAYAGTMGFTRVSRADLVAAIRDRPESLVVFRLLLGLTNSEFAEATATSSDAYDLRSVSKGRIASIESGAAPSVSEAESCAGVIDLMMSGELFPAQIGETLRRKLEKPDTADGWPSVQKFAADGVPLSVFLHQRAYGGAFRQLLDATSTLRGDLLEDPVADLFTESRVPFIRTGSHNQRDIEQRFGLTVRPAPDFVIFDPRTDSLKAILEVKGASDGGTARDKASRFRSLRVEAQRLGGLPVFAVLAGAGWRRTQDALGPVVRDTDGRVFTIATLPEILTAEPLSGLQGLADPPDAAYEGDQD